MYVHSSFSFAAKQSFIMGRHQNSPVHMIMDIWVASGVYYKSVVTTLIPIFVWIQGFPGGTSSKEPTCQCKRQETWVPSLGREDPPE